MAYKSALNENREEVVKKKDKKKKKKGDKDTMEFDEENEIEPEISGMILPRERPKLKNFNGEELNDGDYRKASKVIKRQGKYSETKKNQVQLADAYKKPVFRKIEIENEDEKTFKIPCSNKEV